MTVTFTSPTELSASLYNQGYRNITNFDISTVVISQMSDTYAQLEDMECKRAVHPHNSLLISLSKNASHTTMLCTVTVMDARNLEFIPDQCFDLIIDKGTGLIERDKRCDYYWYICY